MRGTRRGIQFLTVKMLEARGACGVGVALFRAHLGDRVALTDANARKLGRVPQCCMGYFTAECLAPKRFEDRLVRIYQQQGYTELFRAFVRIARKHGLRRAPHV